MSTYTLAYAPASGGAPMRRISNDQTFEGITGAVQVSGRTGNRWGMSLTWVRTRADYMAISGFFAKVGGKRNRVLVPMSKRGYTRQGVGGGTPLVSGAHTAGATTLNLKGLPANTTGILQPGDYIQVGNQLCEVGTILSSTGSPNTYGSITIWPELHKNYADGATVNYSTPGGVFIVMSEGDYGMDHAGIGTFSADFVMDILA